MEHFSDSQRTKLDQLLAFDITRRDLLKAGVAAVFSGKRLEDESAERDKLERSIERSFHVDINTLREAKDLQKRVVIGTGEVSDLPAALLDVAFDLAELATLEQSLCVLPQNMYDYDETLQITCLSPHAFPLCLGDISCGGEATVEVPRVVIIEGHLAPENGSIKDPFLLLVHELTHVAMREYNLKQNPLLNNALGEDYAVKREKYFESYEQVAEPIQRKYENEKKNNHDPRETLSQEELEQYNFIERLRVGFSDKYKNEFVPTEFVAVLAEFYVRGKDWFFHYMNEIFSEDTDNLYSFCKEYIFDGKEYEKLPVE